ncbi:MAG: cytochrome P460 family protein [Acidobacteriota bacterium]
MSKRAFQILTVVVFVFGVIGFGFSAVISKAMENQNTSTIAVDERATAQNPCNPCAKKKAQNPCNPCAKKKAQNPCNPCAKKAQNPCNPCAKKMASGEMYQPAMTYTKWKKVNGKPLLSQPHGGMLETTFLNQLAEAAVKQKASEFPVGAILVKETHMNQNGKRGEKGPLFAMEKTASGWLWITTDASGHLTGKGDSQMMKMCAECHAGAAMDAAFLRKK